MRRFGKLARLGVVAGLMLAYGLLFFALFGAIGAAAGAFAVVPVGLAGALLGRNLGVTAGLLTMPLHVVLYSMEGTNGRGTIVSAFAFALVGGVVGRLRELSIAHKKANAELKAAALRERESAESLRAKDLQLARAERLASLGTLAAGLAHELNNPLAYILANLSYLAEQLPHASRESSAERREELLGVLAETREGAKKVETIVKSLKCFAAEPARRAPGPASLERAVAQSVTLAAGVTRGKARLSSVLEGPELVAADESDLVDVIFQLLVNSAKAIPPGKAEQHEIRVVTKRDESGDAVIEVHDTGEGIRPEELGRVFDPFFTTGPVGSGRGLGLSVCHGTIKAAGGDITVRSEPGRGTTFRVTVPALPDLGAPKALERDQPASEPEAPGERGERLETGQ